MFEPPLVPGDIVHAVGWANTAFHDIGERTLLRGCEMPLCHGLVIMQETIARDRAPWGVTQVLFQGELFWTYTRSLKKSDECQV